MDEDKTNALLAQEYLQLQKTVEDFDARALTIKAWSVTFSATGLGLAYQQHNAKLLLIAAASAAIFWIIESVWKAHQRAFYPRITLIEEHFSAGPKISSPLQIYKAWEQSYKGSNGWLRSVAQKLPHLLNLGVLLPHVLIAAAGLALYRFAPPDEAPRTSDSDAQHCASCSAGR
jgi:hypothetical protein